MGKNFVSNADAQALMQAIEEKKLTVSDTMPAASPDLLGNTRLYIGSDTASLQKGGVYQCQALQVTPAGSEDPSSEGWYVYNSVSQEYELTTDTSVVAGTTYYTIEWKNISRAEVDLSHYKKIWGGSTAAWEQLTDAQKEEYDYEFFDDDQSDYSLEIVDAVTKGDMHPVTSNAVAEADEAIDAEIADLVNVYGAKNILPTPYYSESGLESYGVEYTINSDGTVTANGTATSSSTFYYFNHIKGSALQALNGCIFSGLSDGSDNTFFLSIHQAVSPWTPYCRLTNQGNKEISGIPNDDTLVDCIIRVSNGITVTNKTFYAMIRKPGIKDDTYQPYAMTNKELTDEAKATYQFDEPNAVSGPITINKTFTITEPGLYLCYGQTNPYAAELSLAMVIRKNGTIIKQAANLNQATNVYSPISCATITECNAGDTINFYCENAVQLSVYNALFVVKIGKV